MEDLLLESLTEDKVTYRYYPEGGEKFGIVSLMRKTGKRIHDKPCSGGAFSVCRTSLASYRRISEKRKISGKSFSNVLLREV